MLNAEAAAKVKSLLAVLRTGSTIPDHDRAFLLARSSYLKPEDLALLNPSSKPAEPSKEDAPVKKPKKAKPSKEDGEPTDNA